MKQLNSKAITITRHRSTFPHYEVRLFLPLLFKWPNLPCRSTLSSVQNNTAFSESYGHHTRVATWADREHLVPFLERRRKPQPYTNSRRKFWNSQEYSEVWLLPQQPEPVVLSCWLWRCCSWQVLFCGVTSGGNQNNFTTCAYTWGMCTQSMWCQVQFTTHIVTNPEFLSLLLTGCLNQAVWKSFHIWLKNLLYRNHVSIPIDDQVWHVVCAAQP